MGVSGEVTTAPEVPGIELGRLIASGGTSEVWEGVRHGDGRRVAVKVARAEQGSVEAAVAEASLAAAAADAHLVPVEACLPLADGRVALVMPLLRGGSLAGLVAARGHLAPGEVVTVLAPVAGALGRLHRVGTVHGDLSPGNVLLDLDGRPSLSDLGTARVVGEEPATVWGTEGYLAPEVLLGGEPSPAADVYALGALGWLCLTGGPPGPPGLRPPLAETCRAGVGAGRLVEVVESAVAGHAEDRPAADELAWALFGAAEAVPLHLVEGDDDVSAVTYRLRAAATRPPPGAHPRPRGRHGRRRRGPAWVRMPVSCRGGLVGLAALLVLGGGAAVALGGTAPNAAAPSPPVPTAVASAASSSVEASARPTRSEPSSAGGTSLRRDAPSARPQALLESLAWARAAAWRAGDPELLAAAEAPGSPLLARDTAAVEALARAGLRYAGLRHSVADVATVTDTGTEAVLRARLGTGPYEVVGAGRPRSRAAVAGAVVLVELEWSDGRWRLAGLRAPG